MTLDEAIKHIEKITENKENLTKIYKALNEDRLNEDGLSFVEEEKCAEEYRQLAEWLKQLKQLKERTRWIPVSERLPEETDECLCCNKDGYITIGLFSKYRKEWFFDDDETDINVIAWMPLPEPYESESEV